MAADEKGKSSVHSGAVPTRWVQPDAEMPLLPADQIHVQAANGRVFLTFGQVTLPILTGPLDKDFIADIRPVARLVLTDSDMRNIAAAIASVMAGPSVRPSK